MGSNLGEPFREGGFWALWAARHLAVGAAMVLAFHTLPHGDNGWNLWFSGPEGERDAWSAFANWDGQHYLLLARDGYRRVTTDSHAFFPLLPALLFLVHLVVRHWVLGGLLVSSVFSALALRYLVLWVRAGRSSGPGAARASYLAAGLFLAFPTAFYLGAVYTEALFLCALLGYLWGVQTLSRPARWGWAFVLPLCRPQGVVLGAAIAAAALWSLARSDTHRARRLAVDLAFLLGGVALYLGYFQATLGSALAGFDAQKRFVFDNQLANLVSPSHFWSYLTSASPGWFSYQRGAVDKIFVVAMLLGTVWVAMQRNALVLFIYLALILVPAGMGFGGAFSRYALLGAPLLAAAVVTRHERHPGLLVLVSALLFTAQLLLAARFALNLWVA